MPFLPRNSYYLRVSSSSVLPFYVYLDNEHVDWMSDRVLNKVVADLRSKIIPKLRAESDAYMGPGPAPANAKKGTVDVHRGGTCHSRGKFFYSRIHRDTYQFAYFLRETEPHSVLIKVCPLCNTPEISSRPRRHEISCLTLRLLHHHRVKPPSHRQTNKRRALPYGKDVVLPHRGRKNVQVERERQRGRTMRVMNWITLRVNQSLPMMSCK
ncbi:hypothetical protein EDB86DRAFT_28839 [Lactarius hatsudake]|nr:hypothetical protein EDB86DRAFT_28839 [Lactarius hatsudake]